MLVAQVRLVVENIVSVLVLLVILGRMEFAVLHLINILVKVQVMLEA